MSRDTIDGHKVCETRNAKWLCLNNIYNHFQRPSFYDIGGTYLSEVADFWFMYKTEQVSKLYILHLFICNRAERSFTLSLCNSNEMNINERTNIVHLNSFSKVHKFENLPAAHYSYLTTYSFSELDVDFMKDKVLYIAVAFHDKPINKPQSLIEQLKTFHDFGQLAADPVGADFTIKSADGANFPVHKFLLASRSEVFKAMLKDDTAESISSSVTIDDVSKEDLSILVEFIYTGSVGDVDNRNWFTLLMLGDRYDLKGLKEFAQHVLSQHIKTDNALEVLMAADMYNCASLKTNALKFIKTNIASLENTMFSEINNMQLIQELCKYLGRKY